MTEEARYHSDEGFWSFIRRTRPTDAPSDDHESTRHIDKRQRRACTRGFGISYEWITMPNGCRSGDGTQFNWAYVDGYFQGVSKDEFDRVMGKFSNLKLDLLGDKVAADMDVPYLDNMYNEKSIPDHLFRNSNLPTAKEMEGGYDIIFYGGEATQYLGSHSRTARGTVQISSCSSERGNSEITGTVTMHPCMEEIDVIPFGGNYSFVEKGRLQREGKDADDYYPGDTAVPTGVIKIEVTKPPDGLCANNGYNYNENDYRNVLGGELRVFREKVGAGITSQVPLGAWGDDILQAIVPFRDTEEAEALNAAHYEKTCSWLHRHTILDEASAAHVGIFLCPPPVLFFEEGDIQLDINWKQVASGCYSANSCIIARRRTSNASNGPDPLGSDEMKFKAEMNSVQEDIDKLERKKDMIWLAFQCASILCEDKSQNASPQVAFSIGDKKAVRCLFYMDKVIFNKQMSLYGLRLENIEFVGAGQYSHHVLTFSRIGP